MSISAPEYKFCVKCKHFIPPSDDLFAQQTSRNDVAFGKCALFVKPEKVRTYLVSGIDDPIVDMDYMYASTARSFKDMCGEDALKFERIKRVYNKKTKTTTTPIVERDL
jgi:hypothetical protein